MATTEQLKRWERRYAMEQTFDRLIENARAFSAAFHNLAEEIRANYASEVEKSRERRAEAERQRMALKAADDAAYAEWKAAHFAVPDTDGMRPTTD